MWVWENRTSLLPEMPLKMCIRDSVLPAVEHLLDPQDRLDAALVHGDHLLSAVEEAPDSWGISLALPRVTETVCPAYLPLSAR